MRYCILFSSFSFFFLTPWHPKSDFSSDFSSDFHNPDFSRITVHHKKAYSFISIWKTTLVTFLHWVNLQERVLWTKSKQVLIASSVVEIPDSQFYQMLSKQLLHVNIRKMMNLLNWKNWRLFYLFFFSVVYSQFLFAAWRKRRREWRVWHSQWLRLGAIYRWWRTLFEDKRLPQRLSAQSCTSS